MSVFFAEIPLDIPLISHNLAHETPETDFLEYFPGKTFLRPEMTD